MSGLLKQLRALFHKPELVFITLAIPFGMLSALLVPQLSVNDENNHFRKAYSTVSGNLSADNCVYPSAIDDKAEAVYADDYTADYKKEVNFSSKEETTCGSARFYTPFMHLPQAIGIFFAKLIHPSSGFMVLLGRLANLAFYVVALYFIIKHVRLGKWVFAVIGLFPISIHTAASLSADVMNTVVVLAFFALLFTIFTQKTKIYSKQVVLLLALVSLMTLAKPTNIIFLLPLLFLPARLFRENAEAIKLPFNIHKWTLAFSSGFLAIALVIGWAILFGSLPSGTNHELPPNPLLDNPLHIFTILSTTYINPFIGYGDAVMRGVVGEFSSFQYHLPVFMVTFSFVLLLFTLLHQNKEEDKVIGSNALLVGLVNIGTLALFVFAVTYALYTTWAVQPFRLGPGAPYADGVQGRYFTAALVSLIPIFIWLRRFVQLKIKSERAFGIIIFIACAFSLLFYTIETIKFIS